MEGITVGIVGRIKHGDDDVLLPRPLEGNQDIDTDSVGVVASIAIFVGVFGGIDIPMHPKVGWAVVRIAHDHAKSKFVASGRCGGEFGQSTEVKLR